MNNEFTKEERLFRAVIPNNMYWKKEERPSSAAFKTRETDGLSTDRQAGRAIDECIDFIHAHLAGRVVSVSCQDCWESEIDVCYNPIHTEELHNPYHTLLRKQDGGNLSNGQARRLAEACIVHDQA